MKKYLKPIFILSAIATALYLAATPSSYPSQEIHHYSFASASKSSPVNTEKQKLKVITYNMGYASGDKNNLPVKLSKTEVEEHLQEMVNSLKNEQADLILLQEVDFASQRTFYINQMEYLAKALGFEYAAHAVNWNDRYVPWPYWPPTVHFGRMVSGQAILSRFPILEQQIHTFEKPKENPFWYNWFYLDRLLQKVSIQWNDKKITLLNVHLEAFKDESNKLQHEQLALQILPEGEEIWIVGGDFNSPSLFIETLEEETFKKWETRRQSLFEFQRVLGLSLAEDGNAKNYSMSSWKPVKKIDHIFYFQNQLTLVGSGRIMPLTASDHLPIWAQFSFK